jgi:hypothetical protein
MSHNFQKPKPISEAQRAAARANGAKSHGPVTPEGKAKSALNSVRHGLLADIVVLRTESEPMFLALLAGYHDDYHPEGQTENDLVEEIAAAKWQQQRCWALAKALVDITMDRMEQEIAGEFREIDSVTRTALAFLNQADQSAALALLNRYAARHGREWHRAIATLRAIQKEKRELAASHQPLATEELPNEPEPILTPEPSTTSESDSELATSDKSLATESETSHRPLATGHCSSETDHRPLATDHCSSETDHRPLATDHCSSETGHRPLATDHCS